MYTSNISLKGPFIAKVFKELIFTFFLKVSFIEDTAVAILLCSLSVILDLCSGLKEIPKACK